MILQLQTENARLKVQLKQRDKESDIQHKESDIQITELERKALIKVRHLLVLLVASIGNA